MVIHVCFSENLYIAFEKFCVKYVAQKSSGNVANYSVQAETVLQLASYCSSFQ